jgi:excisionase family DNA binding protein
MLTIHDVAEELRLDYRTVWLEVDRGNLPAYRFGRVWRIKRADLDAYIKRGAA